MSDGIGEEILLLLLIIILIEFAETNFLLLLYELGMAPSADVHCIGGIVVTVFLIEVNSEALKVVFAVIVVSETFAVMVLMPEVTVDALIFAKASTHLAEEGDLVGILLVIVDDSVFILTEVVSSVTVVVIAVTESASIEAETATFVVEEATVVIIVEAVVLYKVADSSTAAAVASEMV